MPKISPRNPHDNSGGNGDNSGGYPEKGGVFGNSSGGYSDARKGIEGKGIEELGAARDSGNIPSQESQELADFAFRLAVKRNAKKPEAMAQKLMTEPDVIEAFELEKSAKRGKAKKSAPAFPDPPRCDCPDHGEILTVHPGDHGRCNACRSIWEFNDDPEIMIWVKTEDGKLPKTG